jgi:3-hydroxyacyl-CoA dehydrogenase
VVGWDLIAQGCKDMYPSLCNDDHSELAEKLVAEGRLGVKTGGGLFDYDVPSAEYMAERSKKIIKMYQAVHEL